ncbi:MAG: hypothetical protein GH144_00115 [Clostridia bacterium]|jgi:hypothetical protein|nr:hypothetical protein [Clostridia bacterium]
MRAKISGVKQMVVPALGIGAGMLASPKVAGTHPTFAKYPELAPLILLIVAVLLLGVRKARSFSIGLGAVALVFLSIAIYNRLKGKVAVAAPPTNGEVPLPKYEPEWWGIPGGGVPSL